MVKTRRNYIGKRYGQLTVVRQIEDYIAPNSGKRYAKFECECECDCEEHNIIQATAQNLDSGVTTCCHKCGNKKISKSKSRPMCNSPDLILNLHDEYGEYGKCKASNCDEWIYFDMDDYNIIKDYCWSVSLTGEKRTYHCVRSKTKDNNATLIMHRLLGYFDPDHNDGNPLNNRRYNLINRTRSENSQNRGLPSNNTSGVCGVSWSKNRNKWEAYVQINGKKRNLGLYTNKDDAIAARIQAEKQYYVRGGNMANKELWDKYENTIDL